MAFIHNSEMFSTYFHHFCLNEYSFEVHCNGNLLHRELETEW